MNPESKCRTRVRESGLLRAVAAIWSGGSRIRSLGICSVIVCTLDQGSEACRRQGSRYSVVKSRYGVNGVLPVATYFAKRSPYALAVPRSAGDMSAGSLSELLAITPVYAAM